MESDTRSADSEALFEAASEPRKLWVVEDAGHQNIHAMVREGYEKRVLGFFGEKLVKDKTGKARSSYARGFEGQENAKDLTGTE